MKFIIYSLLMWMISLTAFSQTLFEGEINYRNFENHSKAVRKFSKGMAYNGARNVKVVIKGKKMHIIDESIHLNTLLLPDENCVIIYNDLLKRGLKCSYSNYTQTYMAAYGPKSNTPGQIKEYTIKPSGEIGTFLGEECEKYKGTVTTSTSSSSPVVTNVEVWCSTKYKVDPVYCCYLNGVEVPGVAMKWTTDQHGKVPLFGSMDSFVASEVKSITSRNVEDSEMRIPSEYELKETDSSFKMLGIYGDTKKYLKKNKLYPADADNATEVTYQIEEEWDF